MARPKMIKLCRPRFCNSRVDSKVVCMDSSPCSRLWSPGLSHRSRINYWWGVDRTLIIKHLRHRRLKRTVGLTNCEKMMGQKGMILMLIRYSLSVVVKPIFAIVKAHNTFCRLLPFCQLPFCHLPSSAKRPIPFCPHRHCYPILSTTWSVAWRWSTLFTFHNEIWSSCPLFVFLWNFTLALWYKCLI